MHTTRPQWTVGEIARHHNAPVHRVEYLIRARGLKPASRAGNLRIFCDEDVELIGRELRTLGREVSK
jgi:DNA-binding transcriptional MerR regulator